MLNLVRKNVLLVKNKEFKDMEIIKTSKHFPSSTREWKDSIYIYNKYNLNLIPNSATSSIKIIKGYFSLFNRKIENKVRTKRLKIMSRLSSQNKILISNGEFKHTNNRVMIDLYLFNREKKNYLISIKRYKKKLTRKLRKVNYFLTKRLKYGINKGILDIQKKLKISRNINNKKLYLLQKYSFLQVYNNAIYNSKINNYINLYIERFLEKYVETTKKKLLIYWYYRQLIYINNSKYNYRFLQYLKEQLYELYNKEIEFNLINLKQIYLNSDILSESIANKISKNRRKIKRYFKHLKKKIWIRIRKKKLKLNRHVSYKKLEKKKNLAKSTKQLQSSIIRKLKYRKISGYRIETKGRLSKRNTASRTTKKVYYEGNLYNIDSSIKRLSTVLLKGNLNPNVQYTTFGSDGGIGSFGIKGWVNGS